MICIYQVKFVSGEAECIDEEFYRSQIEPYEVILPAETYEFFKRLALQACLYASKDKRQRCSHDVKTIDGFLREIYDIKKKYEKLVP